MISRAKELQVTGALVLVWAMSFVILYLGFTSDSAQGVFYIYPASAGLGTVATIINHSFFKTKSKRIPALLATLAFLGIAIALSYFIIPLDTTPSFETAMFSAFAGYFTVGVTVDFIYWRKYVKKIR